MSTATVLQTIDHVSKSSEILPIPFQHATESFPIQEVLEQVRATISPVWPLKDYVAVNPYVGLSGRRFLSSRNFLRLFSSCEMLMPLAYYAEQFQRGRFGLADIETAIDELEPDPAGDELSLSAWQVAERLQAIAGSSDSSSKSEHVPHNDRRIHSVSELFDRYSNSDWTGNIRDEISKYCAAHYDEGQAAWASPWKGLPLYQAWRAQAAFDRNIEILGLADFRSFVAQLPNTPEAAIVFLLQRLDVPEQLWEWLLLCLAFTIPGWSGWVKYQGEAAARAGEEHGDLAGLLAIRLAYDAAISERFCFKVNWVAMASSFQNGRNSTSDHNSDDSMLRCVLLRANELAYQRGLLRKLSESRGNGSSAARPAIVSSARPSSNSSRKLAQMVFCIDVRSERMRRNLESACGEIETFGFAGFFGLPIEWVPLGEACGRSQVPVLLSPRFKMHEGLPSSESSANSRMVKRRSTIRLLRKAWKQFQTSAVSCFSFVETSGLLYGAKLLGRAVGIAGPTCDSRFDGIGRADRPRLGPMLDSLNQQGVTAAQQADLAESILRGMGLTKDFARLVVLCGHGSQTDNNPLQAGLDCGACGGHSGEPNARLAALLLNQPAIRQALAKRGITIPEDVHFLAGLHNTTTDAIDYFDLAAVPKSHLGDLRQLAASTTEATERTRLERAPLLASESVAGLLRRSSDWSEVRPEWGLAGNAAFIAAPRSLTASVNLQGRSFLHNYDHHSDPEGKVLEQIMTAPMIVAHWINMQYYASTVDNRHFGSGTKTVHNVVGRFGIFSGNGGDLMTGLPWESLHDGQDYQHVPLRLLALIAAPRTAIERVIANHPVVEHLLTNGWLNLIAVEDESFFRYGTNRSWIPVRSEAENVDRTGPDLHSH